jgi:hypothetical protein
VGKKLCVGLVAAMAGGYLLRRQGNPVAVNIIKEDANDSEHDHRPGRHSC